MVKLQFTLESEVPQAIFRKAEPDGNGGYVVDVAQLSPSEMASVVGFDPNPKLD